MSRQKKLQKISIFLYIFFTLLPIWAYIQRKNLVSIKFEQMANEIRSQNSYYIPYDNSQQQQHESSRRNKKRYDIKHNIDDDDGAGIILGGGSDRRYFGDIDIVARDAPLRPTPIYPRIDPKLKTEAYTGGDAIAHHAKLRMKAEAESKSESELDVTNKKKDIIRAVVHSVTKVKKKRFFFPPGCSWQCYLRHYDDLMTNIKFDEASALHHYWEFGQYENRICSCKIVLLVGPNKAEFTKLESVAMTYSQMDNIPLKFITPLSNSTTTTTTATTATTTAAAMDLGLSNNSNNSNNTKGIKNTFEDFVLSYFEVGNMKRVDFNNTYKPKFKEEIIKYFENGYNIILGSDEINRIIDNGQDGLKFMDEILSILPPTVIEHPDLFTSLVVYQSPRVNHLYAFYKQNLPLLQQHRGNFHGGDGGKQTFHQFLSMLMNHFHTIDSLKLTSLLVEKGLQVQLLDMSGITNHSNQTFFSVLGCDVLDMECELNKKRQYLPPALISSKDKHLSEQFETMSIKTSSSFIRDESHIVFSLFFFFYFVNL